MSADDDPAYKAFEQAQQAFRKKIVKSRDYDEILRTTTIAEVYEVTFKIQEELSSRGRLRYLAKIQPFLTRLSELSSVIEVFVQVKPELLALIWGPVKLILLWTSKVSKVLDETVAVMASIGDALPRFATLAQTFPTSEAVRLALALFYEDVLDFHSIMLEFLQTRPWKQKFDVLWTGPRNKMKLVISNLQKHERLLKEEVTLLDIKEAKEARTQSLEHFTKMSAADRSSKYLALKSRMSPPLYDDRLDFLQERTVPDCGTWLFRDADFSKWASPSEHKTAWFWLHGIPGAGKTYLASSIVERVRRQGRALFAFVSHTSNPSGGLLARSVLLSLIFQAAEDDREFQSALVEFNERELRGNTGQAAIVLQKYLTGAGLTYIVIDGLDEMGQLERQILLQRLDELAKDCEDLRVLVCSRDEHDISKILNEKAASVRVDERNSGSIQVYIDHRCKTWMDDRQFVPEVRREFDELISPLSAKANGMFLYVRIILDNLEHLGSIEEIRQELRVLPKDLADAYHRIFDRINHLPLRNREKARKVLGWIGCAPAPLTTFEMEQALLVTLDPRSHADGLPRLLTNMEFVKLCGPIIEVVGEELQFVHFTVQEYIFSREITEFIDKERATANLTLTLVAYLGAAVLDLELDDQDVEDNILRGNYRLFEYANFFWPRCVAEMNPTAEESDSLGQLFDRIIQGGRNDEFRTHIEGPVPDYKNQRLESAMPEVYHLVCESLQFRVMDKRWDWNRDNSDSWIQYDPLATSQMLVRIQKCHETLAIIPAHAASLRTHYGTRLFRCTYPFCEHSYRGFESRTDRAEHMGYHGKPWKCSMPNCDFSSIGFRSQRRRDDHWMKHHVPSLSQIKTGLSDPESLDVAEAQPVLFMLIREDNVGAAKRLLSAAGGRKLSAETLSYARRCAAEAGSLEMTSLLAPSTERFTPYDIVVAAVHSQNATFARAAISKSRPEDCAKLMQAIVSTKSDDMYALWEEHILALPREILMPGHQKPKDLYDELFKKALFTKIKDSPLHEARVKLTLRSLSGRMQNSLLGTLLVRVAKGSCSISLATELLELGAPVDYPSEVGRGMTALHIAAKKMEKEAAFFMKYLISQGASMKEHYHSAHSPDKIRSERGAMNIQTWTGFTWDEIRSQYASARAGSGVVKVVDLRPDGVRVGTGFPVPRSSGPPGTAGAHSGR